MEIKMVCATWVKDDDRKVIDVLQRSDRWLSVEELVEITGIRPSAVKKTLALLCQQRGFYEGRRALFGKK